MSDRIWERIHALMDERRDPLLDPLVRAEMERDSELACELVQLTRRLEGLAVAREPAPRPWTLAVGIAAAALFAWVALSAGPRRDALLLDDVPADRAPVTGPRVLSLRAEVRVLQGDRTVSLRANEGGTQESLVIHAPDEGARGARLTGETVARVSRRRTNPEEVR